MATATLTYIRAIKTALRLTQFTSTVTAGDTFTVPAAASNLCVGGLFLYGSGSVTGVTVSAGVGTIGAGPNSSAGTLLLFGA